MEFDYEDLQFRELLKRRQVRFPSDRLTPQALARRSGPCRVYRLGRPMTPGQWQQLPADLRRLYLQKLRQHGGTEQEVSRMLGLSPADLRKQLQGCRVRLDHPDRAVWQAFLAAGGQEE